MCFVLVGRVVCIGGCVCVGVGLNGRGYTVGEEGTGVFGV